MSDTREEDGVQGEEHNTPVTEQAAAPAEPAATADEPSPAPEQEQAAPEEAAAPDAAAAADAAPPAAADAAATPVVAAPAVPAADATPESTSAAPAYAHQPAAAPAAAAPPAYAYQGPPQDQVAGGPAAAAAAAAHGAVAPVGGAPHGGSVAYPHAVTPLPALPSPKHRRGIVKMWNEMKCYGFVRDEETGEDIFYLGRANDDKILTMNEVVCFVVENQDDGRKWAVDLSGPGVQAGTRPPQILADGTRAWTKEEPLPSGPGHHGRVKSWNAEKGYGFILHDCGRDIFVHVKGIDHGSLIPGREVWFSLGFQDGGRQWAIDIQGPGFLAPTANSAPGGYGGYPQQGHQQQQPQGRQAGGGGGYGGAYGAAYGGAYGGYAPGQYTAQTAAAGQNRQAYADYAAYYQNYNPQQPAAPAQQVPRQAPPAPAAAYPPQQGTRYNPY